MADVDADRLLGRSGLRVGPFAFGAAVIGNLYRAVSDEVAADAVGAALRAGVRYFDTAPHYGLGLSERRLGRSLADRSLADRSLAGQSLAGRSDVVISTKVGRLLVDNPSFAAGVLDDEGFEVPATVRRVRDYSRDGVLRSLESSLTRLGVDRVDVVYVHDPDDHYREALDGAFPALEELRSQGVIASYGAGMNQSAMPAEFIRHTDLDVIMLAGRYTLLDQSAVDDLLPVAAAQGVSIVAAGVFNSGILATDRPAADAHYDYAPASAALLDRANRIAEVCERHGVTLPQAAAQFPLRHPAVSTICLGTRTAAQAERNASLFTKPVPEDLWHELTEAELIRPDSIP